MLIHFGEQIEKRLQEVGMTKAELGRRASYSRQGINSLLQKESMDVMLLHKMGVILDYDFLGLLPRTGPIKPKSKRYFVLVEMDEQEKQEAFHTIP